MIRFCLTVVMFFVCVVSAQSSIDFDEVIKNASECKAVFLESYIELESEFNDRTYKIEMNEEEKTLKLTFLSANLVKTMLELDFKNKSGTYNYPWMTMGTMKKTNEPQDEFKFRHIADNGMYVNKPTRGFKIVYSKLENLIENFQCYSEQSEIEKKKYMLNVLFCARTLLDTFID